MFAGIFERLHQFLTMERTVDAIRAAFVLVVTFAILPLARRWVRRLVQTRGGAQHAEPAARLTSWAILVMGIAVEVDWETLSWL